jgi:ribosome-binding ATPase
MGLQIAIVGLPNVGKSTLFNALTKSGGAEIGNYPFCTIDPNVGVVEVPDPRLNQLIEITNPAKIVPAIVEFVDVAGLVKGASEGEGLGNKFLSHIRECDAIAQVVRMFDDENVTHVHGDIDAKSDREVIESELILADLQTLEKRIQKLEKEARSGDKDAKALLDLAKKLESELNNGVLAIHVDLNDDEKILLKQLQLITTKPIMYIANVNEEGVTSFDEQKTRTELDIHPSSHIVPISAKIEQELGQLTPEEAQEFLDELGLKQPGLHAFIRHAYDLLGLQTFFTAGPKEVHAWTIKQDSKAPQAAGAIHTDFEQGFIRAEVIPHHHYVEHQGEQGAKEKGLMRLEGKDYVVQDGDVIYFRFAN